MRTRSRIWRSLIAGGVGICLVAGGVAWVGVRGLSARDHLTEAATLVQQLRTQLVRSDPAARQTLADLRSAVRAARADTADPGWRLGAHLPLVGDDLGAVREVAAALDDLVQNGLTPLVETAATVSPAALTPKDGRIDLAPLQRAAPRLAAADTAVRRARDRVAAIELTGLRGVVRSAVAELQRKLADAAGVIATASRSAATLPPMLGAAGPRTYLVLFQNPAELRATGGIPGAYVVVRAVRGKVTVVDRGAASGWGVFDRPVLDLATSDRALWTDKMGRYPANVNLSPYFPAAAKLAREMYRRHSGTTVDGVLATDPIALSYLLEAVGPVGVPDGPTLTAGNAVRTLLSRMYARHISTARQDAYFREAAQATFDAVTTRRLDAPALLAALARAAGERRLLVWSARAAENAHLTGTVLAGVLPVDDPDRPTVGVFLNDGSGAKLGYYLRQSVRVAVGPCRADGLREIAVRLTLRSTAPKSGLPPYVVGLKLAGNPNTARTVVAVYTPTGGSLERIRLDGTPRQFGSGLDRGRGVGQVVVDVPPGRSRTLEATMLIDESPGGGTVTPRLWTTPAVTAWDQSVESADGCAARR